MSQIINTNVMASIVNLHDNGNIATGYPINDTGGLVLGGTVVVVAECEKHGHKTAEGKIIVLFGDVEQPKNRIRLYHVAAVNDKTGYKQQCTRYPATHHEAVNIKNSFTYQKDRTIMLVEVY